MNWRQIFKSWTGVPVLILAVLGVSWVLTAFVPGLSRYYEVKKLRQSVKEFYGQYTEDKYGGKTPEETYDMFIEALQKEDIELASKYFVINKQDDWLKTLGEIKDSSSLEKFISELQENRGKWKIESKNDDTVTFSYTYVIKESYKEKLPLGNGEYQEVTYPTGEFKADVIFQKNTSVEIWKIYDL